MPYSWVLHRLYHSLGHRRVSRLSFHDRDHGRLGFWICGGHRSHGLGHRGDDRPCVGSSLDDEEREIGRFDVVEYDHGDECLSGLQIDPRLGGRGLCRSAMRLMEGCVPTTALSEDSFTASSLSYLDLEQVISANTLVVHLVVSIICIAATLVFNERKASGQISRDFG